MMTNLHPIGLTPNGVATGATGTIGRMTIPDLTERDVHFYVLFIAGYLGCEPQDVERALKRAPQYVLENRHHWQ